MISRQTKFPSSYDREYQEAQGIIGDLNDIVLPDMCHNEAARAVVKAKHLLRVLEEIEKHLNQTVGAA